MCRSDYKLRHDNIQERTVNSETMPLHVSSSVKLKREKSREQLSKCMKYEDKIQREETGGIPSSYTQEKGDKPVDSTQEKGDKLEDVTLVFSTGQGTFKFELSDVLGR